MSTTTLDHDAPAVGARSALRPSVADAPRQAYRILHLAFIVAPVVAGLDKFTELLTTWEKYLAPVVANALPFSPATFMRVVGVVEIIAGLLVALRPRIGAYVVAGWLVGIMLNLVLHGGMLDIALRDLGLCLGAIALGRLAAVYDQRSSSTTTERAATR